MLLGQIIIKKTQITEKPVIHPVRFDSLENLLPPEYPNKNTLKKYLEQEIFLVPISENQVAKELDAKIVYDQQNKKQDSLKKLSKIYQDSIDLLNIRLKLTRRFYYDKKLANRISKLEEKQLKVRRESNSVELPDVSSYSPYDDTQHGFYSCDSFGNITYQVPYADVQNRYFTIADIVEVNLNHDGNGKFSTAEQYENNLAFLIKEKNNGDCFIWYFDQPKNHMNRIGSLPYFIDNERSYIGIGILTSYYKKAEEIFKGKCLIATNNITGVADIKTGEMLEIGPGSKWLCNELALISVENIPLMVPVFILKHEAGETIKVKLSDKITDTTELSYNFKTEAGYLYEKQQEQILKEQQIAEQQKKAEKFKQNCINKYGQRFGTLISQGKISIGMTQEMCTVAWGEPSTKNRTILAGVIHEQWVYGWDKYLYFENGILTAIQD